MDDDDDAVGFFYEFKMSQWRLVILVGLSAHLAIWEYGFRRMVVVMEPVGLMFVRRDEEFYYSRTLKALLYVGVRF